ncbi:hypothetical protein M885DRAFT_521138 [Pelagophyceae sp. CCMP2097]|nr:hypothetical protein M885DRAFT_521138 [Pelagophyceae sp. CCMP2097]
MAPAGEPVKAKLSRGAALGFIALSSLGFSVQALLVKLLTLDHENGVPPMQIVFVRGCSQLFCCFIVLATHCELRRHPKRWFGDSALEVKWLTARGSVGFFGIAFGFKAFSLLGLAEANVISSSSPVFSAVYAKVFLGEPWLLLERCAAAVTAVGVAVQLDFSAVPDAGAAKRHALGVTCALLSAATAGAAHVLVRFLGTQVAVDWPLPMIYQALGQILLSYPALALLGEQPQLRPSTRQWLLLAAIGALGFFSQVCMTRGMQAEKSASASVMRMSSLPWSFLLQALATPERFGARPLIGAAIITSAMFIIIFSSTRKVAGAAGSKPKLAAGLPVYAPLNGLEMGPTTVKTFTITDDDDDDDDEMDI